MVAAPLTAPAEDPLAVVRAFCREDGAGNRLSPMRWRTSIAPLVAWPLEPAWDRLVLVRGYEIKTPRMIGSRTQVELTYTVRADITPTGIERAQREETVTLELVPGPAGEWLIGGAPHPPHVFEHVVDSETLVELLAPGSRYESNTDFVWQLLRATGVAAPYTSTTELPDSEHFAEVGTAAPGDLVLYYSQGVPYHVGWVESEGSVLSASLNAGRRALPFAAFPGAIRYWRPRAGDAADAEAPPIGITPSPVPLRRP